MLNSTVQEAALKKQLADAKAAAASGGRLPPMGLPDESPFAPVSATMGHDTFHLTQMLWHSQFGTRAQDVDWRMQVCVWCA